MQSAGGLKDLSNAIAILILKVADYSGNPVAGRRLVITYKVRHFTMKWVKTSPKHHHFDLENVSNWPQSDRILKYRPITAEPENRMYIRLGG